MSKAGNIMLISCLLYLLVNHPEVPNARGDVSSIFKLFKTCRLFASGCF